MHKESGFITKIVYPTFQQMVCVFTPRSLGASGPTLVFVLFNVTV